MLHSAQHMQVKPINYQTHIVEEVVLKNNYENAQVALRNLTRTDIKDFLLWATDPEVAKHMTWEAYTNEDDALHFLINVAESHPYFKAIVFEGKVIGSITLTPGKGSGACRAELGYVLAKKYWGKGLATAAVVQAIRSGFDQLKISRIEAFVDPKNIASRRVLEKAGMQFEGKLKNYMIFKDQICDRYVYSMTR